MCIFAVASTITRKAEDHENRCELLQNVYLCSGKHNRSRLQRWRKRVVNCFKMCIFAVASTMGSGGFPHGRSCELLQNVYLCSGKHNGRHDRTASETVVNCFKMCIFAVASTISWLSCLRFLLLWIASKCVSLQWQAQCRTRLATCVSSCELLQNVYLCSGKHNMIDLTEIGSVVVNCFKMCIFAVASTI